MKQNKYGAWAIGAWMLLLTAVSCTDSYEGTPVNMFTEDYLFSRTDSNGVVARPCRYYNTNRLISDSCCTTRTVDSFPTPKNLPHTGPYSTCYNSFYPVWMLSCITANIPGNRSQFPLYDPPYGSPIPKAAPSMNQIQSVTSCHISTSAPTPRSGVLTSSPASVPG